jgi:hypothetical protein
VKLIPTVVVPLGAGVRRGAGAGKDRGASEIHIYDECCSFPSNLAALWGFVSRGIGGSDDIIIGSSVGYSGIDELADEDAAGDCGIRSARIC